jgi:hypothetical protein
MASRRESATDFAVRAGADLDDSVLAIQLPPGAGKTFTGAKMIAHLAAAGRKVGSTGTPGHKSSRSSLTNRIAVPATGTIRLKWMSLYLRFRGFGATAVQHAADAVRHRLDPRLRRVIPKNHEHCGPLMQRRRGDAGWRGVEWRGLGRP